jgi:DNA-binding LacI/PurR family transcriptional regulator
MRTGRFGSATLLLSAEMPSGFLPDPLLQGIHDALQARDMHLAIARLADGQLANPANAPKLLREWSSDGLLIHLAQKMPQTLPELLDRYSIPAVWINAAGDADCIRPDDDAASEDAAARLIELGHERIALVAYGEPGQPPCPNTAAYRREGYERAMESAGYEPIILGGEQPVPAAQAVDFTIGWLSREDRPTALITCGHKEMVAVMRAAGVMGLAIPDDLTLVTFTWGGVEQHTLGVTQMFLPEYEIGKQAVDMLAKKIESPAVPLPPRLVRCEWRDGHTVAPPLASAR